MAVRPIDGNELYRIEKLLDTDIVRQDKVALNLLEQVLYDIQHVPTIIQQNGPLTQADLDVMDYDKVWIDYGGDGEWALVVSGRIYALAVLEGAGFGDILRDEVDGETMDRPSGNYTVYRCPPEAKDNNVPTNEPLTIEELREMDGEPVWVTPLGFWALVIAKPGERVKLICNDGEIVYADKEIEFVGPVYRYPPEGEANA